MVHSKHCLKCNSAFDTKDNRKKYCSRKCAAIVNNSKFIKRTAEQFSNCKRCNCIVYFKAKLNGGFYKRNYCDACVNPGRVRYGEDSLFMNQTKESLYERRKGWQSANSSIRNYARKVYFSSDKPKECSECGYNKHIEICHIKQVKEFVDNATVLEINDIENLIALCPTHHWEFDNLK